MVDDIPFRVVMLGDDYVGKTALATQVGAIYFFVHFDNYLF